MDVRLSEEHESLRAHVAEFAREEVAPVIGGYYERGEFPYPIVARMADMGLFGLPFPEEYGGQGGDYLALCVALEELARVDSSVAITLEAAVSLGAMPIYRFGTEEQKREWLPRLTSGQALGAFGLTEPGSGSDASGLLTHARPRRRRVGRQREQGLHHQLRHRHHRARHGRRRHRAEARRRQGDLHDHRPERHPRVRGVAVATRRSAGTASDTRELAFDDVRVPAENLLGQRGRGYAQFLSILDEGRIAIAALATGLAQGCVDESVVYAREREAFGAPIGTRQAVQFLIADMEVRAHTSRLAWYDAAARMQSGEPFKRQASIAKLVSSNAAMDNARSATQVHGGYGFTIEYPVGRFYRDAKILEIGEGTSEVQRMLIARDLGLPGA